MISPRKVSQGAKSQTKVVMCWHKKDEQESALGDDWSQDWNSALPSPGRLSLTPASREHPGREQCRQRPTGREVCAMLGKECGQSKVVPSVCVEGLAAMIQGWQRTVQTGPWMPGHGSWIFLLGERSPEAGQGRAAPGFQTEGSQESQV